MKQLEHTLKTYVYSHYNSVIFRSTFVTSIYNPCNISPKHLKHLKHTLATCAFSKTWQAIGWSTTQRDPPVSRQLHGPVVSDGAPASGSHSGRNVQRRSAGVVLRDEATPRLRRSWRAGVVSTARRPVLEKAAASGNHAGEVEWRASGGECRDGCVS